MGGFSLETRKCLAAFKTEFDDSAIIVKKDLFGDASITQCAILCG